MKKAFTRGAAALLVIAVSGSVPAPAGAEDKGVVDGVLEVLRERGIVDDAQYAELVSKNRSYEEKQSPFGRIEWFGDFRLRYENFSFRDDPTGADPDNRNRLRYRIRLGGHVPITDWLKVGFRLASGQDDPRSANKTLGDDVDFGPDDIFIDRAFVEVRPFAEHLGDASLEIVGGRMPNPFTWKRGQDFLLWDGDISPEGVAVKYRVRVNEDLDVFSNAGYFFLDENSGAKDPHVFGAQIGAEARAGEDLSFGGRLSWYNFRSLDAGFIDRAAADPGDSPPVTCPGAGGVGDGLGNVCDGLTDSDGQLQAGEVYAYLGWAGMEDWPLLLFGTYAQNFDAQSSTLFPGVGEEDQGWGVGLEFGDKKKYAKLGAGYWHAEANFWPAQLTDSNIFDGRTNGKGWKFWGSRQLAPNTELAAAFFVSDDLEDSPIAPGFRVARSDRFRLQTDLKVKF